MNDQAGGKRSTPMIDPDLYLVVGLVLAALSVPSLLSAWADGRAPRLGALLVLVAGVLVVLAFNAKPMGYRFDDVPQAFYRVIGRALN